MPAVEFGRINFTLLFLLALLSLSPNLRHAYLPAVLMST